MDRLEQNKAGPILFSLALAIVLIGLVVFYFVDVAQSGPPRYVAPGGQDLGDCSNPASPCATWNYAISQADPGDTIRAMEGSYTENVVIDRDVMIEGDYDSNWDRYPVRDPSRTVLSGGDLGRTISFDAADLVVYLDGFRVTDGDASSTFPSPDYGGGVLVAEGSTLYGIDLLIDSNVASTDGSTGWGGGLAVRDGVAILSNTQILSNTAKPAGGGFGYGGGLYVGGLAGTGQSVLHMTNCEVSYNVAGDSPTMSDGVGGGLAFQWGDTSELLLNGNTWSYNVALSSNAPAGNGKGGAISVNTVSDPIAVTIDGDTFSNNVANASPGTDETTFTQGGAINFEGNFTTQNISANLTNLTIVGNVGMADGPGLSRGQGGGLFVKGTELVFQDSILAGNTAGVATVDNKRAQGGAIYLYGSTMTADRLLIRDNIALDGNGSSENLYEVTGGAITVDSGGTVVYLRNSILTDNDVSQTEGNGAGIHVGANAEVHIIYVTIADAELNQRHGVFAGSLGDPNDIQITDTIIVSHTVGIENADLFDYRVVARYNLFYSNISDTVGLVVEEGNIVGAPVFVDPGNRDYHIQASSAARDAALDIGVTTDYDLEARPQGVGFDIGADEFFEGQPTPTPTPTSTPETPTPTSTPGTPTPTSTPGTSTPTFTPGTPTPTLTPGTPTPTFIPGTPTSTPSARTPTPSPTPEAEIFLPVIYK